MTLKPQDRPAGPPPLIHRSLLQTMKKRRNARETEMEVLQLSETSGLREKGPWRGERGPVLSGSGIGIKSRISGGRSETEREGLDRGSEDAEREARVKRRGRKRKKNQKSLLLNCSMTSSTKLKRLPVYTGYPSQMNRQHREIRSEPTASRSERRGGRKSLRKKTKNEKKESKREQKAATEWEETQQKPELEFPDGQPKGRETEGRAEREKEEERRTRGKMHREANVTPKPPQQRATDARRATTAPPETDDTERGWKIRVDRTTISHRITILHTNYIYSLSCHSKPVFI